jgi:hypothetical protein
MHPLPNRTRRRRTVATAAAIAADLAVGAERLDADAERLRAAVVRAGVPDLVGRAWDGLPERLDRAGDAVAAAVVGGSSRLGLPRAARRAWDGLPRLADQAAAVLAAVLVRVAHALRLGSLSGRLLERLDVVALRVEAVRPVLMDHRRALRMARVLAASTIALAVTAGLAFATVARSGRVANIDQVAAGETPARLQALSAVEGNAGAAAQLHPAVDAVGASGPAVATAAAVAPPLPRTIPAVRGALPVGKSMWIWEPERVEGNNADAIVAKAKAVGLQNLYVRTSSWHQGFIAGDFLNRLLPKAHAAGIRVYAWDFPYLDDVQADINQALAGITYLTPDGHRVDGYTADIELQSEGVNITPQTVSAFGAGLRKAVGPGYPLIATVPRASARLVDYPFPEIAANFDALAPMVYWLTDDPAAAVADSIARLAPLGKPIIPIGQAYDAGPEGGPQGVPPRPQLLAFMTAAEKAGAIGVSWWSWQHATPDAWGAIHDAPEFQLPVAPGEALSAGQVRAYQYLLTSLGFPAPTTGVWDVATATAVADYQRAARLPVTGVIDEATHDTLFTPFPPPIHPTP